MPEATKINSNAKFRWARFCNHQLRGDLSQETSDRIFQNPSLNPRTKKCWPVNLNMDVQSRRKEIRNGLTIARNN